MKNPLHWFKSLLPSKKFNPSMLDGFKLVLDHTEYKKHRLSGYTEWKISNNMIKSNKEYKYGYFEVLTNGDFILSSEKISPLSLSISNHGWFYIETIEPELKKVWKHYNKDKEKKYGVYWSEDRITVWVNDVMLYDISDIDIVKYYIEPMRIITSKECTYIKVYQKK
jgi:hypothetical protein